MLEPLPAPPKHQKMFQQFNFVQISTSYLFTFTISQAIAVHFHRPSYSLTSRAIAFHFHQPSNNITSHAIALHFHQPRYSLTSQAPALPATLQPPTFTSQSFQLKGSPCESQIRVDMSSWREVNHTAQCCGKKED